MAYEPVGPGGVSNNYGVRETTPSDKYSPTVRYDEEWTPKDNTIVTAKTDPVTGGISLSAGSDTIRLTKKSSVVVYGDSLSNNLNAPITPSAVSYDNATGLLTCTYNSHDMFNGYPVYHVVTGRPDWNHYDLTVGYVDANTFTLQLPAGLGALPTLASTYIGRSAWVSDVHPYAWLRPARPVLKRNCGVTGEKIAEIYSRIGKVIDASPSIVIFCAGTNDIGVNSTAHIVSNIKQILTTLTNAGIGVIIWTIPPRGTPTAAQSAQIQQVNKQILMIPKEIGGVRVVDAFGLLVDPTSATGAALTGVLSDGKHLSSKGGRLVGEAMQSEIDLMIQSTDPLPKSGIDGYHATNNPNSSNLVANPLMLTTTGGTVVAPVTGAAASGWQLQAVGGIVSAVASVVSDASGYGNAQRVVATPSASGDAVRFITSNVVSRAIPGRKYKAMCRVKTSGLTGQSVLSYMTMYVYVGIPQETTLPIQEHQWAGGSANTVKQADYDCTFETQPFAVPAGASSLYFEVQVKFIAAGNPVTIDVSRLSIELQPE